MYFGCHDGNDAAERAPADDDEDVDDGARCAFADDKAGLLLQCEITTGNESDVGVGGHVIAIFNDNDGDNGNHNTNVISAEPRVGPVVGSESEDGFQSGVVRGLSKSVSVEGLVEGLSVA